MKKNVKFLAGIQDRPYFLWQTAILAESLRGKLPEGYELWIAVCKGSLISPELAHLFFTYPEIRYFRGKDVATLPLDIGDEDHHPGLNKIEALRAAVPHVQDDDLVFLTDTDIFLYGDLNPAIFPEGNALYDNWIVRQQPFFTEHEPRGVDLDALLRAMEYGPFARGGVSIFFDATAMRHPKVIGDCFRWAQALFLLGKIQGIKMPWVAEMPSYALALHVNDLAPEILTCPELSTQNLKDEEVPEGTFYHYYHNLDDDNSPSRSGAFWGDLWHKQEWWDKDFLKLVSAEELLRRQQETPTRHAKCFFELAYRAQQRLYGDD